MTAAEITDLFARLASHLDGSPSSDNEEALQLSISNLNPHPDSRVRVLDTALSLMCFKAPQVFDSTVKYLIETITSVLSSSISCKVFQFHKDEVLLIGTSISRRDFPDLIEACSDVLQKLERHDTQYKYLLCAVLRVAISSSCYRFSYPSRPILSAESFDLRSIAVSKFLSNFPRGFFLDNSSIPFRLMSWFLDPLTLKNDISNILHESMERPFLSPCKEFHERIDWRDIVKCLVLSPVMFIEARALLHRWFLVTGLSSVLELLNALCSVMLDVISRPTWWDFSMDLGAKLSFSSAYFPYHYHLFRILAGPISQASLLQLVIGTSELLSCTSKQFVSNIKTPGRMAENIDHKSYWALAINFPNWFYFASALLFSDKSFQDNIFSKCIMEASKIGYEESHFSAAARYIAWILNPVSKFHQDLLADLLVKISKSMAFKQFGSGLQEKKTGSVRKILKKPKNCNKYNTYSEQYDCQLVTLWLKEFKSLSVKYWTKSSCDLSMRKNTLFRRIPLGILLGCLNYLDEDVCELLLHYAATDRIPQSRKIETSSLKNMKPDNEECKEIIVRIDNYTKEEAIAGASLVFSITDIVESMSASLYETEDAGVDFICLVKMRVGKFLTKCIKRQIQLKIDEDRNQLEMNLCERLKQWIHQGHRVLDINNYVDDLIKVLSNESSL
ncbi:uncharacterized protein LOC133797210 [Humulus lupulus]|uniref:uncharacterized protein LOC133797210 n=1 Tax=Humulus lupulus TaxID=3486 RepID=UPI002B40D035|nr:uncharacterized protein LOC133797210 [Humulus lupulus]